MVKVCVAKMMLPRAGQLKGLEGQLLSVGFGEV